MSLTHTLLCILFFSQSDEEPVCQKPMIDEHCEKHHCEAQVEKYQACIGRVQGKGQGHCEGYAFDLWHCVDHCVRYHCICILFSFSHVMAENK
jgi:hypothetical protein